MGVLRGALSWAVLYGLAGCHEAPAPVSVPTPAEVRARAERWHDVVDLYKPVAGDATRMDVYQAPMFYRERPSLGVPLDDASEFAALTLKNGVLALDRSKPTVYTVESDTAMNAQRTFLWFREGPDGTGVALQGIRATLDQAGYPAVMEVLEDSSGLSLFYVSMALEELSAQAHGAPLPGGTYSVEPDVAENDDVLVVHLVSQGGQALGPLVYEAFGSADVLDIHCRCSASRIKNIGEQVEYELRPLDRLAPELLAQLRSALDWAPADGPPGFPPGDTPRLRLRLAPAF